MQRAIDGKFSKDWNVDSRYQEWVAVPLVASSAGNRRCRPGISGMKRGDLRYFYLVTRQTSDVNWVLRLPLNAFVVEEA